MITLVYLALAMAFVALGMAVCTVHSDRRWSVVFLGFAVFFAAFAAWFVNRF